MEAISVHSAYPQLSFQPDRTGIGRRRERILPVQHIQISDTEAGVGERSAHGMHEQPELFPPDRSGQSCLSLRRLFERKSLSGGYNLCMDRLAVQLPAVLGAESH